MSEKLICEKCGSEMVDHSSGTSVYIECPNCGWGWATTTYNPSEDDGTLYEIWLMTGNLQSNENIRLIADIGKLNMLQAKKMLSSDISSMLYKSKKESVQELNTVQQIQHIARLLTNAGIQFSILPDFPYEF